MPTTKPGQRGANTKQSEVRALSTVYMIAWASRRALPDASPSRAAWDPLRVPTLSALAVEPQVMETIRVTIPATGQLIREIPAADARAADAAMVRARAAQPAWGALPFAERARVLRRVA